LAHVERHGGVWERPMPSVKNLRIVHCR
jgi:hypothetical protein